ncbi:MAG: helix-turn-helix transcriptional regulator [Bdellovibrionota bacterium]
MSTKNKTRYGLKDLEKRLGKMTVGEFLRSWRLSEELSQKEFAKKLKLSPANLCDIEKGRKGISPERAAAIARTLGYSPTVLVRLAIEEQLRDVGLEYEVEIYPKAA